MTRKKRLSPQQISENKARANLKRRVRRLWAGDLTLPEICDEIGLPESDFLELAASLGLRDRPEPDVFIPTPEQIREAAATIRAGWSRAELESRRVAWWRGRLD